MTVINFIFFIDNLHWYATQIDLLFLDGVHESIQSLFKFKIQGSKKCERQ